MKNFEAKTAAVRGAMAACIGLAALTWHQVGRSETTGSTPIARANDTAPGNEEAEGIIFERQQIMLQLDRDAKTLGGIVAGTIPAAKLAETTRSIAQGARESVTTFEPAVPGGRSKPEVWSNHAEFLNDMSAFARLAEVMANAGQSGNVSLVTNLMIDALPCKQCHDKYRVPKPS